jgi:hypothetical protein
MDCANLAATGLEAGLPLAVAAVILVAGVGLLLLAHRRPRLRTALLVALLLPTVVIGVGSVGMPAAQAATVGCVVDPGAGTSLTITQTSTMSGLAPHRIPAPVTGLVTNNGSDDTFITEVVVSIFAVTKASGATAGSCDASDYVLVSPRMPVGLPLAAGGSAAFSGASIGFLDKGTNQNACKGATVALLYSSQ